LTAGPETQSPDTSQTDWRSRLRAWWHGEVRAEPPLPEQEPEAPAETAPPEPPVDDTPSISAWSRRRQEIAQLVFGEGYHLPGGEEWARTLTAPLGLNPNLSVTELGCGLGGLTTLMARDGNWVDAYEPDPDLAQAAEAQARHLGVKQRVTVKQIPLDDVQFKKRSLDAVISREGLLTVRNKPDLLARLRPAMKPNGQLMFTDFLRTGSEHSRVYEVWHEREPSPPHLLTPEILQAELERLNYVVNYIEDVSSEYKAAALHAFHRYDMNLKNQGKSFDAAERDWVLTEGEHWAIRISAMDAHAIRLFRCFCRVVD